MALCPHCGMPWNPTKAIDEETRKQVLLLKAKGCSTRDIQDLLGISFSSAARIIRQKAKEGGE